METFDKIKFKPLKVGWMKRNNDLMKVAVRLPRTYAETLSVLPLIYEASGMEESEVDEMLAFDEIVPALVEALGASGLKFGQSDVASSGDTQGEEVPA